MKVWVLERTGDFDYHGGRNIVGIWATLQQAEANMKKEAKDSKACPDQPNCSFHYDFSIREMEVQQ